MLRSASRGGAGVFTFKSNTLYIMGAYMYPIIVKKNPQRIRVNKDIELESGTLSLSLLRQYVAEDDIFCIIETDEGLYSRTILSITTERFETEGERSARVIKEELYMKNYTEFHSKKR